MENQGGYLHFKGTEKLTNVFYLSSVDSPVLFK